MKKTIVSAIIVFILLVVGGFTIPVISETASDSRVVIDHTLMEYSAPACFDQAEFTNNLDEVSIQSAINSGYVAESTCTTEEMPMEKKPLFVVWFTA
ncbi:hypothetical protein AJ85_20175 [Alkalihalobacillus alcalophilus ATCC 27647 = CGMCC 1.3604]|uniref:Uncharacterized protein n=1 Tax=Alkalihalobacillus alcalophilus ATCC 27647 = CGMCC 1.3604 TaxID=1218173 RepID=A0A094WM95_ALKAL|nr:hypothetical protein [Alkalihalobacillus alcalophilus]KGA97088.1 hypothetical protein BALCAV_0212220 [Alkalihalobacillus alcalophilus ATCC 27647 = CGMCC 1.3604]MED1563058.1 hypothetical protein [Alkalihalobacillus alcalophilus]THG88998.1 hypothetical protein AJ85_20175 [Alkalihalobacillus alcalophilus ATCC 27647 = CGMCC 1.3604]